MSTDSRPIAEGLFTWPAQNPALLGSRCQACAYGGSFSAGSADALVNELGLTGQRQVLGQPKLGYTHVYGAPGISAVTILQR